MKLVVAAGLLLGMGAVNAVYADAPSSQATDLIAQQTSSPRDWNKLMPNPAKNPTPTVTLPASKFTKAPVASQTVGERVSKNMQDALSYAKINDWEKALESVDKAIALDPSVDFLYSFRSKVFKNLGRNNEAVKDMLKYKELMAKNNADAINRHRQLQLNLSAYPDLRTRVKNFLAN